MSDSVWPHGLPGSSVHGILQQEYWSWLSFPSPGDLPNPGIEPASLTSSALAGGFFTTNAAWETQWKILTTIKIWKEVQYHYRKLASWNESQIQLTIFHPLSVQDQQIWKHIAVTRVCRSPYTCTDSLDDLSSVQFSCSVVSDSLRPHESQHARPPCPSPTPGVDANSCPSSRWCHPAISSSVVPFSSCLQSLSASGTFPMSQLFAWGGQSIGIVSIKIKNAHAPLYIIFIPNNYFYKYTCSWGQQNVDKDIHHSSMVLTSKSLGTTKMSNINRLFKKLWNKSAMDILTEWGDFVLCYEMVHTTYWYNLCSKPV